jgi:hypothetical protein
MRAKAVVSRDEGAAECGRYPRTCQCPRRDSNPYSRCLKPVPLPLDYAGFISCVRPRA